MNGAEVSPPEFLGAALKRLTPPSGYKESENLWMELTGTKDGEDKKILMECIVPTLKGWESAGCNIDTGFPCAIMAEMIKNGVITKRGSFAPEAVVPEEPFAFVRVAIFGWLALFSVSVIVLFVLEFIRVYREEGSGE